MRAVCEYYWQAISDYCFGLMEAFDRGGLARGYAIELEEGLWRWRTAAGQGEADTMEGAMDAAEDSIGASAERA